MVRFAQQEMVNQANVKSSFLFHSNIVVELWLIWHKVTSLASTDTWSTTISVQEQKQISCSLAAHTQKGQVWPALAALVHS